MNERRIDYLISYLRELKELSRDGCRVYSEIEECVDAIRKEIGLTRDLDYGKYFREIERITDGNLIEKFKITNNVIYDAYHNAEKEIELYFGRCVGVTTSVMALRNVYDDVVYLQPHRPIPNIADKVVFVEGDVRLPSGIRPRKVVRIRQIDEIGER